jgi:hypothetical protein
MDEDKGAVNEQATTGPREYVVEPERKRPVLIVIIAVVMLILGLGSIIGPRLLPFSEGVIDAQLANKDKLPSAQVASMEKQKEMIEKFKQHSNILVPIGIVEGIAYLGFGIGLMLRKEWARIGTIALFVAVAAFSLVDLLVLNWNSEPGHFGPVISAAVYAIVAYYLSNVGWAFRPAQPAPPQSPAAAG